MKYIKSSCQVTLKGIKLDAVYHYSDDDCYVQLENLLDDKGEQDLMPIIDQHYFDYVIEQIKKYENIQTSHTYAGAT